jgi:RHS repeat-associated protein
MNNTTYYFQERQYRSSQGRWLSPDPAGLGAVDSGNPQTWNRYSYAGNSPLNAVDSTGLCTIFVGGVSDRFNNSAFNAAAQQYGGLYIAPFDGQSAVGAIGDIAVTDASGNTSDLVNAINAWQDDPNGIQIVAFSGGAQAFSTAVESGQLGNVSSGAVSAINQVTYISPGLGLGGTLAFSPALNSTTSVFHGSGIKDFAATIEARLSGQNGVGIPGVPHKFAQEFNSAALSNARGNLTPCVHGPPRLPANLPLPIWPSFWEGWDSLGLYGSGPNCSQGEVPGCNP